MPPVSPVSLVSLVSLASLVSRARTAALRPALACVALAAAACSSGNVNSAGPHDGGTEGGTSEGGVASASPVARFVLGGGTTPPSFLDVPFPTDAYLSNGKLLPTLPGLENTIPNGTTFINAGLSRLNGFSRVALAVFAVDDPVASADAGAPVSAKIDPATLPVSEADCAKPTSSVFVLDLAPGASPALLPCRAAFHDDRPRSQTPPVIAVGPPRGYLLQEAHPYAVVVTSRVKDKSGRPVAASSDLAAVASGKAPGPIGAMYATAYAAANAALKTALATDGATIVSLAAYTTMKKSNELFAMRDALESAAAPALSWDATSMAPMAAVKFARPVGGVVPTGFTASLDGLLGVVDSAAKLPDGSDDPDTDLPVRAHDKIAALGTAVFQATSFLQVKPNGFGDPEHDSFAYDASGKPVAQGSVKIWITFAVPTAPMPAAGYPVVIVQHGLSGSRTFILDLANKLATQGWLVAGIDSVTFGARAPEPANQTDTSNAFGGPGSTYKGPDGFADTENGSTDFFGNLASILAVGDHFRQAGFDTAQVVKLLRSAPDLSPLATGSGTPKIDPSHIAYIGDSLGAMEGTIAAAIEPNVQAWYLNVNAGSLFVELSAHSPTIGALLQEGATFNYGVNGDTFNWSDPLLQILQQMIEPGDPISYAQYLTTSPQPLAGKATQARNAVQVEAIWDDLVTDEAGEAMARAAGWGLASPNVGSNADITDLAHISDNPRATPLVTVSPDSAGAIHDTPATGATGVLVQCGPCQHGSNLVASHGSHNFQVPYVPTYTRLATPVGFTQDYRGLQSMGMTFFADAFQGKVPRVMGFSAPVRDEVP